jgi:hypothetical protein
MHLTIERPEPAPNYDELLGDLYGATPMLVPPLLWWATGSLTVFGFSLMVITICLPAFAVRTVVLVFKVAKRLV